MKHRIFFIILFAGLALAALTTKTSRNSIPNPVGPTELEREARRRQSERQSERQSGLASTQAATVAPFIVKDTATDSPGTNLASRLVKFTAEVGGTQPLLAQWKVKKSAEFLDVPGATNVTLWITNAQVSDSGLYALFVTNSAGSTNTTPQPLIVVDGED
ncbi:MAG: hypothetical protein C5B50_25890 [Verrucomicrobia bacterium]|nr:MAG: hypothetical protein C5B50_25890 [Verrucomicrobiota bacterium]